jgi:hypothetical protein
MIVGKWAIKLDCEARRRPGATPTKLTLTVDEPGRAMLGPLRGRPKTPKPPLRQSLLTFDN